MSNEPNIWSSLREHLDIARSLRKLEIFYDSAMCTGAWECYEVCPVDCWTPDYKQGIINFHNPERCIACGACALQCPEKAISLEVPHA